MKKYSFPNFLVPDEEKITEEFGLSVGKAIEYEWFNVEGGSCKYSNQRDEFHKLRMYARGEQSEDLYKHLLDVGDESYSNFDFRPIQVAPKFIKLIANQMSERLFDIKAEAVDKFSTDLKDGYRKSLEDNLLARPAIEAAKQELGIDLTPEEGYMDSMEEIDLHMKLRYKPAIEIACEEAIKYTLDLNNYDETQSRVIEDITTLGIGGIKHHTDSNKGIVVEYVDPAQVVYSYTTNRNFKDVHYWGEVKRMTKDELKRISDFTNEQLKDISSSNNNWRSSSPYSSDNLSGVSEMVEVLYFTFKTTNKLTFKKKNLSNGGYKMTQKESTFEKTNENYDGYDVVKKSIEVWYEGALVLGTELIFNYKLCENMIRPEGLLNITMPNYIFYAPEIYQNRPKGEMVKIIPYIDQMQQIHIKLQQLIAKAKPSGVYIDASGLEEIALGDGGTLNVMEVIKIYNETGNLIGTSTTDEGGYTSGGGQSVRELRNTIDNLDKLIGSYNHYLNLIRDAIGIPQGADASMPHPDTLVGVQQMVALSSNAATRHILDAMLNISESLGKGLALRIKDIFKYSDLKKVYINAIGKLNVKTLKALENYHLHDLGINIELKPDAQQMQMLEANINMALSKELIYLDDAIDIRNVGNFKLANELLKVRRQRREKEKQQFELQKIQTNNESQTQATQMAAQAKMQQIQAEAQAKIMAIQAQSEADARKINAEKEAKSELMAQEFNYNAYLQGLQVNAQDVREKEREDRKDKRQRELKSMESELVDQRNKNSKPKKFESSEDNISGEVEMSELEPS